ncbi:hypothetical protein ABH925_004268 [Streptacidiphilus sp. EB129]
MDYARMLEIADELAKLPESWTVEISGDNVILVTAPSNPHQLNVRRARQQLDPQVQRTRPGWVAENEPEVAVPGVKRKRRPDLVVCRESALERGTALDVADVLLECQDGSGPRASSVNRTVSYASSRKKWLQRSSMVASVTCWGPCVDGFGLQTVDLCVDLGEDFAFPSRAAGDLHRGAGHEGREELVVVSEARAYDQIVHGGAGCGLGGQVRACACRVQPGAQGADVGAESVLARRQVELVQCQVFRAGLRCYQIIEIAWRVLLLGQGGQVSEELPGAHQVDAGEQDPEGVEQGFAFPGPGEQLPLCGGETLVVVGMVAGEQTWYQIGQLGVNLRGVHHERREELFEDVAVGAQQQSGELRQVVGDQVHLDSVAVPHPRERLDRGAQPGQVGDRQQMRAPQVDVGVS